MPEIKLQHVVSCSSEDKNHPADNILRPEGTHKWKCATTGEKSVSVVLQFEKSTEIHSIDIGNEGSAFVEVLVGKSTASSDKDYQVLLVASSFMTPMEARNGTNRNSVRMFDSSKLSATAVGQKWDRVKVVCTQPFNKTSTFGLSFIKFHGPGGADKKEAEPSEKLGFFKIKSDKSDDVKPGNLFSNRGKVESITPPPPVAGAAAMRAASRVLEETKPSTSAESNIKEEKKQTPKAERKQTPKAEKKQTPKPEKKTPTPAQNREKRKHDVSDNDDTDDEAEPKPSLHRQSTSISSVASRDSAHSVKQPPLKKTKSEPPKESPVKEFRKIMDKVVFVMSGYQNPYRAELRDRALAMGATYKPDWGKGCTHLICAFVNTPKYQQVSGKGRIVDKKWINDCYKQKKLLPWRNYRLGDAESPDEASDDEIVTSNKKTPQKPAPKEKKKEEPVPSTSKSVVDNDDDDDNDEMYGGDTDSGEDTDEEIRRIKEGSKKKTDTSKVTKPNVQEDAVYDVDTDEDGKPGTSGLTGGDSDGDSGFPELPDFFADKHFFIYGNMEPTTRRRMIRYITAYAGELEDYMNDKVKYVVTSSKWDDNFYDAISDNPDLVFVKPKWVEICHEKSKFIPHQPFSVIPDA